MNIYEHENVPLKIEGSSWIFYPTRDFSEIKRSTPTPGSAAPIASLFNIASNTFSLGRCHSSTRGTGHLDGHPKVVMVVHLGDHPKNIGNIHVVMFQITRIPWESEFRSPFGPNQWFFLTGKSGDPSPNPSVANGSLRLEKHQSSQWWHLIHSGWCVSIDNYSKTKLLLVTWIWGFIFAKFLGC